MRRREALRILGTTAAARLVLPDDLFAFGLEVRKGLVDRPDGSLSALTEEEARTVSALAEVILPATDTPGATDAGVVEFVDVILAEWLDADERDRFLEGLADVDRRARALEAVPFDRCSIEAKVALTTVLDDELTAVRAVGEDTEGLFFREMKRFALAGYFTSEVGMRSMGYRVVPGAWEACVLLDEYGAGTGR